MFISAILITVTWQISSAKSMLEMKYKDFGFTTDDRVEFVESFVHSAMKSCAQKVADLPDKNLAEQILKDDKYWLDLKIILSI